MQNVYSNTSANPFLQEHFDPFSQTFVGKLNVDLGSSSQSDFIFSNGNATLSGELIVRLVSGYTPQQGDVFTLLVPAGTVNGDFTTKTGIQINSTTWLAAFNDVGANYLIAVALPGDANLNGGVDFDDLLTLAQNYSTTGRNWPTGDFTGDGLVGFDDLLALAQNYGRGYGTDLSRSLGVSSTGDFNSDWALALATVPEPASVSALGLLGLIARRRRH